MRTPKDFPSWLKRWGEFYEKGFSRKQSSLEKARASAERWKYLTFQNVAQ